MKKRNKRKLVSMLLAGAFVFSSLPAAAIVPGEGAVAAEPTNLTTCRIEFEDGISINSMTTRNNVAAVADVITEIAFTVDAGQDIITLGYYFGDDPVSYPSIVSKMEEEIDKLNEDIATVEALAGNKLVQFDDLELKYVSVANNCASTSSEAAFSNLSAVKAKEVSLPTPEASTASVGTIDSSYHYQDISMSMIRWYYNGTYQGNCSANALAAHLGDGNTRHTNGYYWYPNDLAINFYTNVSTGTNYNRTMLQYKYDQTKLNNLAYDTNETLEVEVQLYNYFNASAYGDRGHAFQTAGAVWASSQPSAYLDTTFGDDPYVISLCVGCSDATQLVANRYYYWRIDSAAGYTADNYPNDGRFRAAAQRGYRAVNTNNPTTWTVFAEEHEPTVIMGLNPGQNWVPATSNAWILAGAGTTWTFNDAEDLIRP